MVRKKGSQSARFSDLLGHVEENAASNKPLKRNPEPSNEILAVHDFYKTDIYSLLKGK